MMSIMIMGLSSVEKNKSLSYEDQFDNYIISFQCQKITYNGVQGYFIPSSGFSNLEFAINKLVYYDNSYPILESIKLQLQKELKWQSPLKTAFGVSLSINFISILIMVAEGFFVYSFSKQ
jgi:hypothetical protein